MGGREGLFVLAMTQEQFREKVWKALFEADYHVRYWTHYKFWVAYIYAGVKIILGLASAAALMGLWLDPKYQYNAAAFGAVAALFATIIIPAFNWDSIEERIIGIRNAWIDVRCGYELVWEEIEDETQNRLDKQFRVWISRQNEIERRHMDVPHIQRLQEKAYAESELLCGK